MSPYLWSRGIRRLDAVAISHAHTDHMGGMRSVIANFQPRELWYGVKSPSRGFVDSRTGGALKSCGSEAMQSPVNRLSSEAFTCAC